MYEQFRQLAARWREDAKLLERHKARDRAELAHQYADELEDVIEGDETLLNLTQASKVSGYTRSYVGRLVREGKIPNRGRDNAPKVAAKDLPIKPGHLHTSGGIAMLDDIASGQVLREVAEGVPS